jgi:hypothetical protein
MGSICELTLEHVSHYLAAVDTITRDDGYISWMRSNYVVLYLLAMMMPIIWRTVFGVPTSSSKTGMKLGAVINRMGKTVTPIKMFHLSIHHSYPPHLSIKVTV